MRGLAEPSPGGNHRKYDEESEWTGAVVRGEWGAAEGATFLTDSDELRQNQGTVKTNKAAASVCVCVSGAEWMSAAMHPGGVPLRASRIRAGTFEGVRIGSTQYGGLGRIGDTSTFGIC